MTANAMEGDRRAAWRLRNGWLPLQASERSRDDSPGRVWLAVPLMGPYRGNARTGRHFARKTDRRLQS